MRSISWARGVAVSLLVALCACGKGDSERSSEPTPPAPLAPRGPSFAPTDGAIAMKRAAGAPLSLTASDGSGLELVSMVGRAVVEGPLAFTELRLTFRNPEARVREGHFRVTLPAKATVSRLAMKLDDKWQEGEVVEKKKARRAYEDFLHRKQDPALLEQAEGNEFQARVFPIPANGIKEIILSYSEELRGDDPYAMQLGGLSEVGALDLQVYDGGQLVARRRDTRVKPTEDFGVRDRAGAMSALRSGELAAIPVKLSLPVTPDPVERAIVLVDTSASRALGFDAQIDGVAALLAKLGAAEITVAAFDQTVDEVASGRAAGIDLSRLRARGALGASDLSKALAWAHQHAKRAGATRVIVVGDGVATAGETGKEQLSARVRRLSESGVLRLDTVAVGGLRDDDRLRKLTTSGLAHDGAALDLSAGVDRVAARLSASTHSRLAIDVPGARFVSPSAVDGAADGDDVLVFAEVARGEPLRVVMGGQSYYPPATREVERPLLERAVVRARINALLADDDADRREENRAAAAALGVQHRVVSPVTSLLVLETERDYERFGIDRRALADILTVKDGALDLARRTVEAAAPADLKVAQPKESDRTGTRARADEVDPHVARQAALRDASEFGMIGLLDTGAAPGGGDPLSARGNMWGDDVGDSFGAGGLSLSGIGEGGGGRGEGIGLGRIGTLGHGAGGPPGAGFGSGTGRLGGQHRPIPAATTGAPRVEREAARPAPKVAETPALSGKYQAIRDAITQRHHDDALLLAKAWQSSEPGDVLALTSLGDAYEASGDKVAAARAFGSIIDLFPTRADLRRYAAGRLDRLGGDALDLAIDDLEKAVEDRPDHPSGARALAMALAKRERFADALDVLAAAIARVERDTGRFPAIDRILREDMGLIGAALIKREPQRRDEILAKLATSGAVVARDASLRFVLSWETDANDVDFHIEDAQGGHAYYGDKSLPSGGTLYADVTRGYGPECFTVNAQRAERSASYHLKAHYYARGPMGYGMGRVQIVDHDGKGGLTFEERPFVVMNDRAFVDLGVVKGK